MTLAKRQGGFSYIEIIVVVVLLGTCVVFLLDAIPGGLTIFTRSTQEQKFAYLAREKMAEIQAQGIWIANVDTQNPAFPARSNDLANQWKSELDYDSRAQSTVVRGQIQATLLTSSYTAFAAGDFLSTLRERFLIVVSLSQGGQSVSVSSYLTLYPSQKTLLGILHLIRRALILYQENTGSYPGSNNLSVLVPNYLPYIPNDPYTRMTFPVSTNTEERTDYAYTNSDGVRKIFAGSHTEGTYPNLVLTW